MKVDCGITIFPRARVEAARVKPQVVLSPAELGLAKAAVVVVDLVEAVAIPIPT